MEDDPEEVAKRRGRSLMQNGQWLVSEAERPSLAPPPDATNKSVYVLLNQLQQADGNESDLVLSPIEVRRNRTQKRSALRTKAERRAILAALTDEWQTCREIAQKAGLSRPKVALLTPLLASSNELDFRYSTPKRYSYQPTRGGITAQQPLYRRKRYRPVLSTS